MKSLKGLNMELDLHLTCGLLAVTKEPLALCMCEILYVVYIFRFTSMATVHMPISDKLNTVGICNDVNKCTKEHNNY
jgi:hypothetical protein